MKARLSARYPEGLPRMTTSQLRALLEHAQQAHARAADAVLRLRCERETCERTLETDNRRDVVRIVKGRSALDEALQQAAGVVETWARMIDQVRRDLARAEAEPVLVVLQPRMHVG